MKYLREGASMDLQASFKLSPNRLLLDGVNMFFALLPDEQAKAEIIRIGERFVKSHRLGGSSVDIDRLHITLTPIGKPDRLRQPLEGALLAAAENVRMKAFEVTLDSAMRFSNTSADGRFPFVLCADASTTQAALNLRKALAQAQYAQGLFVPGVSSYMPHVTLLYGHGVEAIEQPIPPISWRAREFMLIRSFFGQSRHEVMGRWPLDSAG
ncbi:2'-5' RNA ligase [Rhodanobacter sp. ANJX3]|jgi:2'-5' RNA ligase|uniref:2'-5' RNA ligase family protein n=1 Tax=Rhodanobacter sp. ANJX3 TaxID=2723083 RepID=UPI0017F50905|nr:2'-5' RNA ligase family protein [Rhodanobacter sp. ANJX3]MBB5358198.1 2'-5' RNA ligase [Rhodanobacter sp. ANJX3]